jgi:hypothetical protein
MHSLQAFQGKGGQGMDEYNINPEYRGYIDRYCKKHNTTPDEAVRHIIVKNVEAEYRHRRLEGRR